MTNEYDVVIVGAGFAGLITGRELSSRGLSVAILEGRDRIGGRTWTDHRLGHDLELGGTWFHNLQPHVWAELVRYGKELTPSPDPEVFVVATNEGPHEIEVAKGLDLLAQGLDQLTEGARDLMPRPFNSLFGGQPISDLDKLSVADRLKTLSFDDDCRVITEAFLGVGFQSAPEDIGLAHAYRITSLSQWDAKTELEAAATFKLVGGTRGLAEAISRDSKATVALNTEVTSITSSAGRVVARTATGEEYAASSVVVTAPINALSDIDFNPPLSPGKRAVVDAGQASHGVKIWVRVKGEVQPFLGFASPDLSPLHIAQYEYSVDGDSLLVLFGSDNQRISPEDRDGVEAALRHWLPDAEVIGVDGHDWTDDRFSRQTWANLRPGQLSDGIPQMQLSENEIYFAGSDYASGWLGYIDGAVETALGTARQILDKHAASND